jgi:hypothetical protein
MNPIVTNAIYGAIIGGIAGGLAALGYAAFRRVPNCPECDGELPRFQRPQSLRQTLAGGWVCPGCGCDVDSKGKERKT